jgi:hypothetical protein
MTWLGQLSHPSEFGGRPDFTLTQMEQPFEHFPTDLDLPSSANFTSVMTKTPPRPASPPVPGSDATLSSIQQRARAAILGVEMLSGADGWATSYDNGVCTMHMHRLGALHVDETKCWGLSACLLGIEHVHTIVSAQRRDAIGKNLVIGPYILEMTSLHLMATCRRTAP